MPRLACFLLLCLPGLVNAASTPDESTDVFHTQGLVNGRLWNTLSNREKLSFLFGYSDGLGLVSTVGIQDKDLAKRATKVFWPNLTFNEISSSLDKLYSTPENGPIAIANALIVVSKRASGSSEEVISKDVSQLRADASRAQ